MAIAHAKSQRGREQVAAPNLPILPMVGSRFFALKQPPFRIVDFGKLRIGCRIEQPGKLPQAACFGQARNTRPILGAPAATRRVSSVGAEERERGLSQGLGDAETKGHLYFANNQHIVFSRSCSGSLLRIWFDFYIFSFRFKGSAGQGCFWQPVCRFRLSQVSHRQWRPRHLRRLRWPPQPRHWQCRCGVGRWVGGSVGRWVGGSVGRWVGGSVVGWAWWARAPR